MKNVSDRLENNVHCRRLRKLSANHVRGHIAQRLTLLHELVPQACAEHVIRPLAKCRKNYEADGQADEERPATVNRP